MVEFTGSAKLQRKLAEIAAKVRGGTLRVGFLEGATYPDGTPVAMVAAINEFGAPSRGQPPRPFMRIAVAAGEKHWGRDLGKVLKVTGYDADASLALMGERIKSEIQQSIVDFQSPALAESTAKAKGSDKPLIDTGHMLNSVDYDVKK